MVFIRSSSVWALWWNMSINCEAHSRVITSESMPHCMDHMTVFDCWLYNQVFPTVGVSTKFLSFTFLGIIIMTPLVWKKLSPHQAHPSNFSSICFLWELCGSVIRLASFFQDSGVKGPCAARLFQAVMSWFSKLIAFITWFSFSGNLKRHSCPLFTEKAPNTGDNLLKIHN